MPVQQSSRPSRNIVEQSCEARRVVRKASLNPARLQLPQRLADGPPLGDTACDKIGARERQARFFGVLQKFSRALPFVIVPQASIGLRQCYCVARRLAAVSEEQAPQSIRLWRLVKPMQPDQRQRAAFETLRTGIGKARRLAQARRILGYFDTERGKTQERILWWDDRHDAPQPRRIRHGCD